MLNSNDSQELKDYLYTCLSENQAACLLLAGEPPTFLENFIAGVLVEKMLITMVSGQEVLFSDVLGFPEKGL